MTAEEPLPQPTWQGVWSFGGDLQISDLSFAIGEDGTFTASTPTVRVRTDLWPFWLHDAVDAAEAAIRAAERIGPLIARLDAAGSDEDVRRPIREELTAILFRELRACMRTMTACASLSMRCMPRSRTAVDHTHMTLTEHGRGTVRLDISASPKRSDTT